MLLDKRYGALASGLGPFRVLINLSDEPLTMFLVEGAGTNNLSLVLVLGPGPWPWNLDSYGVYFGRARANNFRSWSLALETIDSYSVFVYSSLASPETDQTK